MVAKGVFEGGSVAFGDFPPSPVGLPTQKLSLSPPPKRQRAVFSTPPSTPPSKEADVHFSGGSDAQQGAAFHPFYTQNASARRSVQSRRPEAAMSPAQLLELRATELAIRRVDLAIQEQRGANLRLEIERERDIRRAQEHEQKQQQQPDFRDAAIERQKLRIEEAQLRISEQHARLQLAQLQREPAFIPPSTSDEVAVSAASTPAPEQFRAISAALQLKQAQVFIGKDNPLVNSALVELGAVNRAVAIAEEKRKQADIEAQLAHAKEIMEQAQRGGPEPSWGTAPRLSPTQAAVAAARRDMELARAAKARRSEVSTDQNRPSQMSPKDWTQDMQGYGFWS